MADPGGKESQAPDPFAVAVQPNDQDKRAGNPAVPASQDEIKENRDENDTESSEQDDEKEKQPGTEAMRRTRSAVTETSIATTATTTNTTTSHRPVYRPWYKTPNPLKWGAVPPVPKEKAASREKKAGFFSLLTFHWMAPLMNVGYKRPLELNDLWAVNPDRSADKLTGKLKESFNRRVARGDKYPLLWAMHETFFFEFWFAGMLMLMTTIVQVMSPFTLRFLIQFANDAWDASRDGSSPPPIGRGIGLVLGVTFMQILQSLGTNHAIYRGMMVGGQSRAVLISVIFEKSMAISGRAKAGGLKENTNAEHPKTGEDEEGKEEKDTDKKREKKTKKDKKAKDDNDRGPGISGDGTGWGNGRITNLMSVDTYRIDQCSAFFHMLWGGPLSCLITLAVLCINLGESALAGFGLLVVAIPLLAKAIKSLFQRRKAINKITDQRVSLTQEILSAVKFVKYFGWEPAFLERLEAIRKREIRSIQVLLAIRNAINAVSVSLPIFASMLAFIAYSLSNNAMQPAQVFSSLALFNGLRMPLNILPLVLGQVVDAWSSVKRIQEFLLAEEQKEDFVRKSDGPNAVEMHDAVFTWERTPTQAADSGIAGVSTKPSKDAEKATPAATKTEEQKQRPPSAGDSSGNSTLLEEEDEREPFKLQGLDFEIKRDELVAVIGTVGSGKSSLLAALAGDMRKTSGEVVLGASRAFCPQYAWVQNATVRNNILFGKDMDRGWYEEVVGACALWHDLEMLPNGDTTEIGERGITISGGQKQRLNIARAIYYDADIVIMDDPLSAVDAHVGRHIFDQAILGLLKDKCRILATHQLWVLNRVDRIVWMEGGKIMAIDTFDNLMRDSPGFRQLMETTAVEKKKDDDDDDEPAQQADAPGEGDNEKKKRDKKPGAALMQQEDKAVASVPWSVYGAYVRASGTILNAPIVFFFLLLALGANLMAGLWLSYWTSDRFGLRTEEYIGVYAGLGFGQALLTFAYSVLLSIFGTTSSRIMLRRAVTRVLRAPMSFFDTTPLGRVTNRFSRDVDVMDNNLTDAMRMYFTTLGMIVSVFALIIAFFPWFALALVPLLAVFVFAASYYRASAREVKRFESVLRSNVFAKFGEGLTGVASIRAYGLGSHFVADLRAAIDEMNTAYYLTFSNQRWLSTRLDLIGTALVFTVGVLVVTSRFSVPPSIGGLVLSYILGTVQMIQFTVRQLAEVENGMISVERLQHYGTELQDEAPLHTTALANPGVDLEARPSWPEQGAIVFDDVRMRYREDRPLVLGGVSMRVRGGERIGIVGRTGAGKSSIMSALFRLVELSGGSISIDGVDISQVGLHDLRSRMAIIPQDPTLFRGTVRSNLDPFGEHTDLELWSALRQADLVPEPGPGVAKTAAAGAAAVDGEQGGGWGGEGEEGQEITGEETPAPSPPSSSRIHLDGIVEEDGLNFSLGQRQLMALARALVRGSRIIVCDEATSSVDMETDDKIQRTMAEGFRGRTLLCIAHRLSTIIGYDRICVMDGGVIAELGTPVELWEMGEGAIFRAMCERSGIRGEDVLAAAAGGSRGQTESQGMTEVGDDREKGTERGE